MGKRKRPPIQGGKQINLETVSDTGDTNAVGTSSQTSNRPDNFEYEKIEPSFNSYNNGARGISWQEIVSHFNIAKGVAGFFLLFILPFSWYLSKLDSNVDNLKTDVHDVKSKTDELARTTIRQGERLDAIEKSVDGVSAKNNPPKNRAVK